MPSADHPEGTVIEVVEKGYRAGDDLVRAAKVVVARRPLPIRRPAEPAV